MAFVRTACYAIVVSTGASAVDWIVVASAILVAMLIDRLMSRRAHDTISFRLALARSTLWLAVGLSVAVWIALRLGTSSALTYVTAYLVEESLSVDNLFVFLVIFRHFQVTDVQRNRVLFWGVFGAIALRGLFIVAGTELLRHFSLTAYIFGGILVISGLKLLKKDKSETDPEHSPAFRIARRVIPTTHEYVEDRFFVTRDGRCLATPLLLVLIAVEFTDILFAVDSVPAVLAISQDLYVVYTSNILAVLGLRALFFLLAGMMDKFHRLDLALALVLVFVGLKMACHKFIAIPNLVSLAIVLALLGGGVLASLLIPPKPEAR